MGISMGHIPYHERCPDSLVLNCQLCGGSLLPVWYVHVLTNSALVSCYLVSVIINTIKYRKSKSHEVNVLFMSKIGSL